MLRWIIACLTSLVFLTPLHAASFYTDKPDDPDVVVLTKDQFPNLHADGVGDDTETLQQAITQASRNGNVLLIPQSRYLITKTIGIPASTRVLGYGKERPVFVLGAHTPGFDQDAPKYMVWFSGGGRGRGNAPSTTTFPDASAGTFYSGLSNIDFEIQDGNPAAVAIRSHFAQHCTIAHVDFNIGSGYAGIDAVGNEAEDLHFHGGNYGIVSAGTSPGWQFTLLDSSFDGQRIAGVKTHNTGLTFLRDSFVNMPTAVAIDENMHERLYMKYCKLENITGPALIVGDEGSALTHINLEDIICLKVPQVALYSQSKKQVPSGAGENYVIKQFSYGLQIADVGEPPTITQTYTPGDTISAPENLATDIVPLPPMNTWTNIKTFGAKGDGSTDDLPAFQAAIDKAKVIFLPRGRYRVTDTIQLKPDTILIGLNPITTQIGIDDNEPKFMGDGNLKAVIEAPHDGSNILVGLGIDTSANNNRAAGLKWMAGPKSMVNDVKFLGGHGTTRPDRRISAIYNLDHTGDGDPSRKWNSDGPSLWITDGGCGTFADIWTANTFASCGMLIENTSNPGRIYELSSEHHVRNEIILRNVSNWSIYSQQTEEEWGEGKQCLPLEISHCSNLTYANTILYRVFATTMPYRDGVKISDSHDIRFLGIRASSHGPYNFDDPIVDVTHNTDIRPRELAFLNLSGNPPKPTNDHPSPLVAPGATMQKIAGDFISVDHAIADSAGNAYFVDFHQNKVFQYSPDHDKLTVLRDDAIDPFGLALDRSENLLILSRQGKIFSLSLKDPHGPLTALTSTPAATQPAMKAVLASDRWFDGRTFAESNARLEPLQFISADQSIFTPVPNDYYTGRQHGLNMQPINLYRCHQLALAEPGKPFYVADENEHQTWLFTANSDGTLADPKFFAPHGEAGVITDASGNVYIAEGDIFVYDPSGKQIDLIHVPDRPLSMVFCGKDRHTFLIAARDAVYYLKMAVQGS